MIHITENNYICDATSDHKLMFTCIFFSWAFPFLDAFKQASISHQKISQGNLYLETSLELPTAKDPIFFCMSHSSHKILFIFENSKSLYLAKSNRFFFPWRQLHRVEWSLFDGTLFSIENGAAWEKMAPNCHQLLQESFSISKFIFFSFNIIIILMMKCQLDNCGAFPRVWSSFRSRCGVSCHLTPTWRTVKLCWRLVLSPSNDTPPPTTTALFLISVIYASVCPLLEPQESPLPNKRRYTLQPWDGSRTQQLRGGTPDRNHALLSSPVVISWSIDGSIFSVGRSCSGGRACAVDHLEPPSAAQCHLVQSGGLPVRGFFRLLTMIR